MASYAKKQLNRLRNKNKKFWNKQNKNFSKGIRSFLSTWSKDYMNINNDWIYYYPSIYHYKKLIYTKNLYDNTNVFYNKLTIPLIYGGIPDNSNNNKNNDTFSTTQWLLTVIGIVFGCSFIVFMVIVYICFQNYQKNKIESKDEVQMEEIQQNTTNN